MQQAGRCQAADRGTVYRPIGPDRRISACGVTAIGDHFLRLYRETRRGQVRGDKHRREYRAKANQTVEDLSRKGYRTLGVARSLDDINDIQIVNLRQ